MEAARLPDAGRFLAQAQRVGVRGLAYARGGEPPQTAPDVEGPGVLADVEALVAGHETVVREAQLGGAVLLGQLEPDLGSLPLALVVDEAHVVVDDLPDHLVAGHEF